MLYVHTINPGKNLPKTLKVLQDFELFYFM